MASRTPGHPEGRETIEIYKLLPPDDFEPVAFVELLADVFDVVDIDHDVALARTKALCTATGAGATNWASALGTLPESVGAVTE